MIFNTKKKHTFEVAGLTIVAHAPNAIEQAQYVDAIIELSESQESTIMLAKKLFELCIDDITGLVDEDGTVIAYNKVDGIVNIDYINGFHMSVLKDISKKVKELSEATMELKKK